MEENHNDEIINVRLPRKDYEIIRKVIERERTYSWLGAWFRSGWVWAVVGTSILVMTAYEQTKRIFLG